MIWKMQMLKPLLIYMYLAVTNAYSTPCGGYEDIYVCKDGDPAMFVICSYGYQYEFQCPPGLQFNVQHGICDWPGKGSCDLSEDQIDMLEQPDYMPMYENDENNYTPWEQPTTTTSPWWPTPRRTTPRWFQQNWSPTRKTPRQPTKPRHRQLTQPGWNSKRHTTSNYDDKLIRRPSDPWVPITTAAQPTNAPWENRLTERTPQVAWKERKAEEQNGIQVESTTEPPSSPQPVEQNLDSNIEKCTKDNCQLPNCRCPGVEIPGGIPMKKVPQMVMLTFDDKVSEENFPFFRRLFTEGRNNPNGCPIKSTFFVSKLGTDFAKVDELYKRGHEIASHSKSYRYPHSFWAAASYGEYKEEIEGMREEIAQKTGIPHRQIKGMRVPFLQIGGDNQYQMLHDYSFLWDSSMVTGHLLRDKKPPTWPFTLDYPVDCKYSSVEPRPKKSYPGLWEVPVTRLYGHDGRACSMADSCARSKTPRMALKYLRDNFLRHYTKNRAPMGIFVHASWFKEEPYALDAMEKFIEKLTQLDDVWFVTVSQAVEWTRNPTPIDELDKFEPFKCKKIS